MRVVPHDRHVPSGGYNLLEQLQTVIRIAIGHDRCGQYPSAFVPIRMFWMCSNSGARSGSMYLRSTDDRMIIGSPPVTNTSVDLGVGLQIGHKIVRFLRLKLQVLEPHELGPPKAISAIGMTR